MPYQAGRATPRPRPSEAAPAEWTGLRVDGLVGRALRLSAAELARLPQVRLTADFECLEGWTAPALPWEGVPLGALLERAGVAPAARWVQASAGGYSVPLPLGDARQGLLALRLGDAPLSPEQGAPVRLVVPGHACYTSIKGLDRLELRAGAGPDTGQAAARARLATADAVRLLSVNVSPPRELGRIVDGGREVTVRSGIAKRPVAAESLYLDWENLEGDGQADRRAHGGRDKAVYVYPAGHWPAWRDEEGRDFGPAAFGENLTVGGVTEDAVCIGDVWAWGEALLQVSQPRGPCFKLEMHTGRPGLIERMRANGRTGWYLRVLRPGRVPVAGPLRVSERHPVGVSVLRAHLATVPGGVPDAERRAILRETPLAEAWRRPIRSRLAGG